MAAATVLARPARMAWAWLATHPSAALSPSRQKHQAAFHRYSMTWMKSMMMCTRASWSAAWVLMRSIWWLLPSTRATQVRRWSGSRRVASSKTAAMTSAASAATLAVSHLPRAAGPGWAGRGGWSLVAVALLAFGQAGGQLAAGRGLGGGLPKRLGAHDDALGVAGQHQHVGIGALLWCAGGVEVLDVGRGAHGQLLCLALAQQHPGGPLHRLHSGAERAAGGLDGRQAPQPVGVFLLGQAQRGVGGVQVGGPSGAVGDARHADRAQHGGQATIVAAFDVAVVHPVGVAHPGKPSLSRGAEVQVVLQQLPQHVPTTGLELRLQLGVGRLRRRPATQPVRDRVEQRTGPLERRTGDGRFAVWHWVPSAAFWIRHLGTYSDRVPQFSRQRLVR